MDAGHGSLNSKIQTPNTKGAKLQTPNSKNQVRKTGYFTYPPLWTGLPRPLGYAGMQPSSSVGQELNRALSTLPTSTRFAGLREEGHSCPSATQVFLSRNFAYFAVINEVSILVHSLF